ncbi:MAG: UbiA family prenyltransferase [Candidatus Omnitrophota bacterium]
MIQRLKDFFEHFESEKIPLSYVFLTFLAAVMLRTFWEHTLLMGDPFSTLWGSDHAHFVLFYTALALSLVALLHAFTGVRIASLVRVVFPAFIFLVLVPVWDRVSNARNSFDVTYYFPDQHPDIFRHFFLFFGPLEKSGATPGMRVEIALVLMLLAIYVFIKTRRVWKALGAALLSYVVIFAYLAMPFVVQFITAPFHVTPQIDIAFAVSVALLLLFPLVILVSYLASPVVFMALARDMRWMRLGHYLLLIVLGAVMSARDSFGVFSVGQDGFFRMVFLFFGTTLAWAFCVISNNWADEAIDRISSPERPSVTGVIPADLYRFIGWGVLCGAIIYAWALGSATLEVMAVFIGAYFVYSMPPLRLKRLTVVSKFVIGFNSLLMFMLGYMFWSDATTVPPQVIIFFLFFFTLSANFIDIKDHAGDQAGAIRTLPVVMGPVWAKRLIGLSFVFTYLAAYDIFMSKRFFWICCAAGLLQCFLINRKNYDEKYVLWVHLASLIFIIGCIAVTIGRMI